MEQVVETLNLLKRQAHIQDTLRHSDANRVLAERELYLIQKRLARFPATLQAIAVAAAELHKPVDALSARDIEKLC